MLSILFHLARVFLGTESIKILSSRGYGLFMRPVRITYSTTNTTGGSVCSPIAIATKSPMPSDLTRSIVGMRPIRCETNSVCQYIYTIAKRVESMVYLGQRSADSGEDRNGNGSGNIYSLNLRGGELARVLKE